MKCPFKGPVRLGSVGRDSTDIQDDENRTIIHFVEYVNSSEFYQLAHQRAGAEWLVQAINEKITRDQSKGKDNHE